MNAEPIAHIIITMVQGYLLIGLVFAIPFVWFWVQRVDYAAQGSTWGFKLVVLPGVSLLWPLMLSRLIKGKGRPTECTRHRNCGMARATTPAADEAKS